MMWPAECWKHECLQWEPSVARAATTVSPNTRVPRLHASFKACAANLLITCTTYNGESTYKYKIHPTPIGSSNGAQHAILQTTQSTCFAITQALLTASASTSSGLDSSCPSGPVIPFAKSFSTFLAIIAPFSACT